MRSFPATIALCAVLVLLLCAAGCSDSSPAEVPASAITPEPAGTGAAAAATEDAAGAFTLHVDSVADGGTLPVAYTCAGSFESPPVSWENVPEGTKTLTLIMEDRDAASGTFTHWIVYNIPPNRKSLPAGITAVKEIDGGGLQGSNSMDERGYYPVCPPVGSTHRYVFTLYAVDYTMGLLTADRESIDAYLDQHWIEDATVTTTFKR